MHLQLQINSGLIFVLERESGGLAWAVPAQPHQSSWPIFQQPSRWRAVLETSHRLHLLEEPLLTHIPSPPQGQLQELFQEPQDLGRKGEEKDRREGIAGTLMTC